MHLSRLVGGIDNLEWCWFWMNQLSVLGKIFTNLRLSSIDSWCMFSSACQIIASFRGPHDTLWILLSSDGQIIHHLLSRWFQTVIFTKAWIINISFRTFPSYDLWLNINSSRMQHFTLETKSLERWQIHQMNSHHSSFCLRKSSWSNLSPHPSYRTSNYRPR